MLGGYQSESPKRTPRYGKRGVTIKPTHYSSPYARPDYTGIGRAPEIDIDGERLEKEAKRVLALIESNTAEENYKLYMNNAIARKLFLERADVCNCSQHGRRRLADGGSFSVHSIKSLRSSMRKKGFDGISENTAEYEDDIHGLVDKPLAKRHNHHHHGHVDANGRYMPCRRTCSTIHHPMFHAWGKGGRPRSAGAKKPRAVEKIDWRNNQIANILDMAQLADQIHT